MICSAKFDVFATLTIIDIHTSQVNTFIAPQTFLWFRIEHLDESILLIILWYRNSSFYLDLLRGIFSHSLEIHWINKHCLFPNNKSIIRCTPVNHPPKCLNQIVSCVLTQNNFGNTKSCIHAKDKLEQGKIIVK